MVSLSSDEPGVSKSSERPRRRLSVRNYLFIMGSAILLPTMLFAAILFRRYYDSEIGRIDQELQSDARELASNIDRDLQGKIVTLETLATAGSIEARDYGRFYARATIIKAVAGVDISLRDRDGEQLVNTRVAQGTPLPRNLRPIDEQVAASKKPGVSGFIEGAVARRPIYIISVPRLENGTTAYILHMTVDLSRLDDFLKANLAGGELAGILDRDKVVMARTEGSRERLGKPASKSFADRITAPQGTWLGDNVQGYKIRLGYATSKLSGWIVWVGVRDAAI